MTSENTMEKPISPDSEHSAIPAVDERIATIASVIGVNLNEVARERQIQELLQIVDARQVTDEDGMPIDFEFPHEVADGPPIRLRVLPVEERRRGGARISTRC